MSKSVDVDPVAALTRQYAHLLSLAAHEFRTPASVVGGYLRMLQKDTEAPLSERHRKMVDEAARSCARLVALVSEMSDIAKLDLDLAPSPVETFDLFSGLEEVAGNVHEGADRDVILQLSGTPAGALVSGDRHRIEAAFATFFRALLREQPTAVTMAAHRSLVQAGGATRAVVVIARSDDVLRAYDAEAQPFDENRGGIGLSLPIARRVIERAGGRVWAPRPHDEADRAMRSAIVVSIPLPE